jgi:hypothetical protein
MKFLRVLPLILLASVAALGQNPGNQPDAAPLLLLNLEAGYTQPKQPSASSHGPALLPVSGTDWASLRERGTLYRTNIPLAFPARPDGTKSPQQAAIAEQNPAYNSGSTSAPAETRAQIAYSVFLTAKNSGGKVIKAIEWEYLLVDPVTQEQIQRNKLRTKKELKPGETTMLTERVKLPRGRSAEPHNLVDQRVLLKRIEYADGSSWRRP